MGNFAKHTPSWFADLLKRCFRICLDAILLLMTWLWYPDQPQFLPPIIDPILLQSATSLANQIKSGKLKSEEVVRVFIKRCHEVDPYLNAIVDECFEDALRKAKEVDLKVERELSGWKFEDEKSIHEYPFLGVPFTAKNSIGVKGKTQSVGLVVRKEVKADHDCVVVERMERDGGAIFLALTNVPELLLFVHSFNHLNGQTNNPYDMSRTSGGSSGGEGALIGAAASVIGIGSDLGGSIRIPSHNCGIYGHKTTPTLVPFDGTYPFPTKAQKKCASLGPMCRYVEDLRPMLKILTEGKLELPKEPLRIDNLKVFSLFQIDDPLVSTVNGEVIEGLKRVLRYLECKGAVVKPLDTTNRFYNIRHFGRIWEAELVDTDDVSILDTLTGNKRNTINPYWELAKCAFGTNRNYTAPLLFQGILEEMSSGKNLELCEMAQDLRDGIDSLLGKNGIILCPTFADVAYKHHETVPKVCSMGYCTVWNFLNVACTTIPIGLNSKGLPLSVQAIATAFNDNLTIQIAEELSQHFSNWTPPCPVIINQT